MEISATQIINPGILDYDDTRRKELAQFQTAVRGARFLDSEQKKRWNRMGYLLDNDQLEQAQRLITLQDLRRLKTQANLEKIKTKER